MALLLLAVGAPTPASAGSFTLTDDNSTASIDTESQAGMSSWVVDDVEQLTKQWFWYRVGNTPEASIDTLTIAVEGTTDTNFDEDDDTLFVRYTSELFDLEISYTLDGGQFGSGSSDMSEQISIINTGEDPLNFHFFQYSDFDLEGTAVGDIAVFTNANSVQQYEAGGIRLTETVVTPVPSHREIAAYATTLGKLNDGVATTLSDTAIGAPVGPGDLTWAYQWDVTIDPGSTFQISKDKNLNAVPEPASLALVALGLVGLAAQGRAKR